MGYECPSCGFTYVDNMGGTLDEAMHAWRIYMADTAPDPATADTDRAPADTAPLRARLAGHCLDAGLSQEQASELTAHYVSSLGAGPTPYETAIALIERRRTHDALWGRVNFSTAFADGSDEIALSDDAVEALAREMTAEIDVEIAAGRVKSTTLATVGEVKS